MVLIKMNILSDMSDSLAGVGGKKDSTWLGCQGMAGQWGQREWSLRSLADLSLYGNRVPVIPAFLVIREAKCLGLFVL